MNILITGGNGYVGRCIVNKLIEDSHTVINYNRRMQLPNQHSRNIFQLGELSDLSRLISVIKQYNVERIIHTSAQSHPLVSLDMPLATVEINTMGLMNIFEAARLSGIKRVVCYSSDTAYGKADVDVVTEEQPLCPTTPYGVTKATAEMMARAYNKSFDMDIIALRVCAIYGPGQVMPEYIRDVINAAKTGEPFIMERGGDHKYNLAYVTDVADASIKACFTEKKNDLAVYNITSGYQPTLGELANIVGKAFPDSEISIGPGTMDGWDVRGFFSIEAARRDLGYEPKVSLEEGMHNYIEWLKQNAY